jgi:hypothetical protein
VLSNIGRIKFVSEIIQINGKIDKLKFTAIQHKWACRKVKSEGCSP